jgi:aspartate/methionine/tyrosine aminotransferase
VSTEMRSVEEIAGAVPLARETLERIVRSQRLDLRRASIREMNKLVNAVERETGIEFIRMEFGIPGLPVHAAAIEAEVEALQRRGVAHVYAPFDGLPELKQEAARFARLFLDVELPSSCCIPTLGAMEGCFASLALAGRLDPARRTVLCLDPGFPVNKLQLRFLGLERAAIDFYDHRGSKLVEAVERRVERGDVAAVLWSSPNNPTWIVLDETELEGIGRICDRHDVLAVEDLAYFGMDLRRDYLTPGQPPFQPTILRHTANGVCLFSSSKIFSYAGQRIALAFLAPALMQREAAALETHYGTTNVFTACCIPSPPVCRRPRSTVSRRC